MPATKTRSVTSKSKPAVRKSTAKTKSKAPPSKITASKVASSKAVSKAKEKPAVATAARKGTAVRKNPSSELGKLREEKFVEIFGAVNPKGRTLGPAGESLSPTEHSERGWCIMQFPPRAGRLSWLYVTNGLSALRGKGREKPSRIELVLHWRDRDVVPLRILAEAARSILEHGSEIVCGHMLSSDDGLDMEAELIRHCVAFEADKQTPSKIDFPGGSFTPLVLLGISDAEHELALKVRADLADGRQVLMEALRMGGIYPVTDPKRQCITRRRDFHRLWENAFRIVRERKA